MLQQLLFLIAILPVLVSCQPSIPEDPGGRAGQEQLYIDARRGFTINHPQSWKKILIPVSSPEFREDTVVWKLKTRNQEPALFSISSVAISDFSDLQQFSEHTFTRMYKELDVNQNQQQKSAVSMLLSSKDKEILYINLALRQHYYHLSLASPKINKQMKAIFTGITQSLQEIEP